MSFIVLVNPDVYQEIGVPEGEVIYKYVEGDSEKAYKELEKVLVEGAPWTSDDWEVFEDSECELPKHKYLN